MRPQEHEIPPSQRDRSLPMIVNLRGDEDYAEDFHIDAEGAMELLGIKRSRLTQISGRELRVGRIRRDRYLRPMYRELDLRDYQDWTRATATHQSSSKAIEQAIDSLDDRFNDLFVVLGERLQHFQGEELSWTAQEFKRLRQLIGGGQSLAAESGERLERALELQGQQQQATRRALLQLLELAQKDLSLAQETSHFLSAFHQDLRELISSAARGRREQLDLGDSLGRSLREEAKTLAELLAAGEARHSAALELTITRFQVMMEASWNSWIQAQEQKEKQREVQNQKQKQKQSDNIRPPRRSRQARNLERRRPYLER